MVRATWLVPEEDRPAHGSVWVHAQVTNAAGSVEVVAPYQADLSIPLRELRLGSGQLVRLVLRETEDPNSAACSSGESQPFELVEGEETRVEVFIDVQPTLEVWVSESLKKQDGAGGNRTRVRTSIDPSHYVRSHAS